MIKITVLTLFPEFINSLREYGVIGRAVRENLINLEVVNIRDYSNNRNNKVDDEVYGGGAGMLMNIQPIDDAIKATKSENSKVIFMSPQGSKLTQEKCINLSKEKHLILLCGHYEGVDSRVVNYLVDEEISIGDYVLTGGEIPAMVLVDSVSRLMEGVLGSDDSPRTDSHYNILLQHDVFTRPRDYNGLKVPEVLFSGNHKEIEKWKLSSSIKNTKEKRPDLYDKYIKSIKEQ